MTGWLRVQSLSKVLGVARGLVVRSAPVPLARLGLRSVEAEAEVAMMTMTQVVPTGAESVAGPLLQRAQWHCTWQITSGVGS